MIVLEARVRAEEWVVAACVAEVNSFVASTTMSPPPATQSMSVDPSVGSEASCPVVAAHCGWMLFEEHLDLALVDAAVWIAMLPARLSPSCIQGVRTADCLPVQQETIHHHDF